MEKEKPRGATPRLPTRRDGSDARIALGQDTDRDGMDSIGSHNLTPVRVQWQSGKNLILTGTAHVPSGPGVRSSALEGLRRDSLGLSILDSATYDLYCRNGGGWS